MNKGRRTARAHLLCGAAISAVISMSGVAFAQEADPISIPSQSLATALNSFGVQTGRAVMFKPELAAGKQSRAVDAAADPELALNELLSGTGLSWRRQGDLFMIVETADPQSGSAAGDGAEGTVDTLVVTAQKREEDIQDVPIAISAFTQESLERSQIAGGPDLMTQVPNMTFTKTNFSSYSIQIRGIGTQAISATTDAAVAVAFNNTPFIRNRFFEQEFYDLQRVEVLRGPQGTLYGRNATAGVVNIISQKPSFGYEAKLSADVANYNSTRLEGMFNIPLVEDMVALRLAGAWTKREGYVTNEITGNPIDGRDLWSTRLSLRVAPTDGINVNLVWEHFEEDDDRLRSGKQLCHQDDRTQIGGYNVPGISGYSNIFSQGCIAASLYSPVSFEAPNGYSLPYYLPMTQLGLPAMSGFNPYASLVQSKDLRVIESTIDPKYRAKSDLVELQFDVDVGDSLTLTSETGYNYDTIFSLQDYNRFNTARGAFRQPDPFDLYRPDTLLPGEFGGIFCDPQLGCADRLVAVDVSRARSRQFSQEFRVTSDFEGPFNFSLGANFLRYDNEDKYYVFINTLSLFSVRGGQYVNANLLGPYEPGVTDNFECLPDGGALPDFGQAQYLGYCIYVDPNPIESVNDRGHNYFLSKNPYKLISYAVFGEAYYNLTDSLKVTAGLRWTVDKKEAPRIPSWVLASDSVGYPVLEVLEQEWREPTGRLTVDWKPDLGFTDETLLYGSYARGYKAGGANPPPSGPVNWGIRELDHPISEAVLEQSAAKPKKFDAEFVDAFELGAKNTLAGGAVTLNLSAFYYDYKDYQISQIIDRSAVNYNFDAEVWGLEIEADWRPLENLRLGFKGGYENTRIGEGEEAIDIMDRTAGRSDWVLVRPFPTYPSNCILPLASVARYPASLGVGASLFSGGKAGPCEVAYALGRDPATNLPYVANPTVQATFDELGTEPLVDFVGYAGYDPTVDVGQNNGEGFVKQLGGNELPNAPHFTATVTADYTIPLPNEWLATLHTDLYYQSEAWTRVFNTDGYDKLKAYTNVNLAAIFTNEAVGWKVMAYIKNVLDRDSITGAFLNSDDTGLTTNVFLTEPRLYGLRVTKDFDGGPWWTGADPASRGPFPLTVELGGSWLRQDAAYDPLQSEGSFEGVVDPARVQNRDLDRTESGEVRLAYRPSGAPWFVSAAYRFGSAKSEDSIDERPLADIGCAVGPPFESACETKYDETRVRAYNWIRGDVDNLEEHQLVDFEVGHDVGLGWGVASTVEAGVRYAEFTSSTALQMKGTPDADIPELWAGGGFGKYGTKHVYDMDVVAEREFKGLGPILTWDLSKTLWGADDTGHLNVDLSLSGGVLFGKQKMNLSGREISTYYRYEMSYEAIPLEQTTPPETTPATERRSSSETVQTYAAALGLSYEVGRFKVGSGYRWERFSNVLDGGFAEREAYDRTLDGPYFKLSVGFGG